MDTGHGHNYTFLVVNKLICVDMSCTHFCFPNNAPLSSHWLIDQTSKRKASSLSLHFSSFLLVQVIWLITCAEFLSWAWVLTMKHFSCSLKASMLKGWQRCLLKGNPAASPAGYFASVRAKLFIRGTYDISVSYLCLFSFNLWWHLTPPGSVKNLCACSPCLLGSPVFLPTFQKNTSRLGSATLNCS